MGQDVVGEFDNVNVESLCFECFGCFESDESGTEDDGSFGSLVNGVAHGDGVGDGAECAHAW